MAKLESQVVKTYTLKLDNEEMIWLKRVVTYPIMLGNPQEIESPGEQIIRERLKQIIATHACKR